MAVLPAFGYDKIGAKEGPRMEGYLTLILGSSVDLFYAIDHYPDEGDFTHGKELDRMAGGPPLNVGCVASSLGAQVKALDYLNPDEKETGIILGTLRERGVDTEPVKFGSDCTCGKVVILNRAEKRTMIVIDPVRPHYDVDTHIQKLLNGSRYMYSLMHIMNRSFSDFEPIREARRHGAKMIFDGTSQYDDPARAKMLLDLADGLFINSTDYGRLSQCIGEEAKNVLLNRGCEFVCVTNGEKGAHCYTKEREYFCPAFRVEEVIDSTGSGDSFAGAFLASRLKGKDYEESLRMACAAGAYCCLHVGGQGGCAAEEELLAFAKKREPAHLG